MGVEDYRTYWFNDGALVNAEQFKSRCAQLISELHGYYRVGGSRGMKVMADKLRWVAPYTTHGQHAWFRMRTQVFILLVLAEAHLDHISPINQDGVKHCLKNCRIAHELIDASRKQIVQSGFRPPNIGLEEQCRVFKLLANVMWLMPKPVKTILTAEQLIDGLIYNVELGEHCRSATGGWTPEKLWGIRNNILWAATQIAKAGHRFVPRRAHDLIQFIDAIYDGMLTDKSLPFWWDLQIGRGYAATLQGQTKLTTHSLDVYYSNRYAAMRRYVGPRKILDAYIAATQCERVYIEHVLNGLTRQELKIV